MSRDDNVNIVIAHLGDVQLGALEIYIFDPCHDEDAPVQGGSLASVLGVGICPSNTPP
jgi:hypothetical protein